MSGNLNHNNKNIGFSQIIVLVLFLKKMIYGQGIERKNFKIFYLFEILGFFS